MEETCFDVLRQKGYNLKGYSVDTIFTLQQKEAETGDECIALLWWLESRYG